MLSNTNYVSLSEEERDWMLSRALFKDKTFFYRNFRRLVRFIFLFLSAPKLLITKYNFIPIAKFENETKPNCIVCSKSNARVSNIFNNTLKEFNIYEIELSSMISFPDFKRFKTIICESLRYDFYSLKLIAELYDFMALPQEEFFQYDAYATSDGVSPLNKVMCLKLKSLNKKTIRIVNHAEGPSIDPMYDFNFLTESYTGKINQGWIKIKGKPWLEATKRINLHKNTYIGLIGNPEPYYIFGIEYWLLPIIKYLKKRDFEIKVRLHPQASEISAILLKYFFKVEVTDYTVEPEEDFIKSLNCLIASYRSSLIDIAISNQLPVILNNSYEDFVGNDSTLVDVFSFQGNNKQIFIRLGEAIKKAPKGYSSNKDQKSLPTIFEVIYDVE